MRIGIPAEAPEPRVAATPETVKKMVAAGHVVAVQTGAGALATYMDADYQAAGATLEADAATLLSGSEIVMTVGVPTREQLEQMKPELVELAQREAKTIFEDDPELTMPEHRLLRERIDQLTNARSDVS